MEEKLQESPQEQVPEKAVPSVDTSLRKRIFDMVEPVEASRKRDYYDFFMIFVIGLSLVPLMTHKETSFLRALDHVTVTIFIIDYILRWITADYKFKNHSFASFLFYPFTPMAIIDLISILPSLFLISKTFKALRIIRMLRAFRAFRALRIIRYSRGMLMILEVLKSSKNSLIAVAGLVFGYILICALIVFNVEPGSFDTFFEAIYWATVSLTTIGYGDIYPVSFLGRLMTMVSSIIGIAVIALPAGIVTAEFMNELQSQEKEREQKEREQKEREKKEN